MTAASVMTYDSLVEDIKTYSERPNDANLAIQIPRIILLAESEVASDLKILGNELILGATMQVGQPAIAKPAYWRRTTSLVVTTASGRKSLQKRTYEYARNFWPDPTQTGEPRYYAEYNYNNFLVVPTPDAAYPFEICYFARLDPLSSSNQTNWTTANAPQTLLYCCMYHTSLFLKNFDKADAWRASYTASLQSLSIEDESRNEDRTTEET